MTEDTDPREGGAWIGQHPDLNTQKVRDELDEGAERVAVTNNESSEAPDGEGRPSAHREADTASEHVGRRAGEGK